MTRAELHNTYMHRALEALEAVDVLHERLTSMRVAAAEIGELLPEFPAIRDALTLISTKVAAISDDASIADRRLAVVED